jgi:hypothetical protein
MMLIEDEPKHLPTQPLLITTDRLDMCQKYIPGKFNNRGPLKNFLSSHHHHIIHIDLYCCRLLNEVHSDH